MILVPTLCVGTHVRDAPRRNRCDRLDVTCTAGLLFATQSVGTCVPRQSVGTRSNGDISHAQIHRGILAPSRLWHSDRPGSVPDGGRTAQEISESQSAACLHRSLGQVRLRHRLCPRLRKGDDKRHRLDRGLRPAARRAGLRPDAAASRRHARKSSSRPATMPSPTRSSPSTAQSVYYARFHNVKKPGSERPVSDSSDIFKIHVKTRKVVQLTRQEFTPNTGVVAERPAQARACTTSARVPLPGGKVMFTSNRNGFQPTKGYTPTTLAALRHGRRRQQRRADRPSEHQQRPASDDPQGWPGHVHQLRIAGLRDLRLWAIWTIHPDGTNWGPLVSAFGPSGDTAYHFMTQLSDGQHRRRGVLQPEQPRLRHLLQARRPRRRTASPSSVPPPPSDPRNLGYNGTNYIRIPFTPHGLEWLTPFCTAFDAPARLVRSEESRVAARGQGDASLRRSGQSSADGLVAGAGQQQQRAQEAGHRQRHLSHQGRQSRSTSRGKCCSSRTIRNTTSSGRAPWCPTSASTASTNRAASPALPTTASCRSTCRRERPSAWSAHPACTSARAIRTAPFHPAR